MRTLLDANILISYFLSVSPESPVVRVVKAGILGEYQLLLPEELLEEFTRKIPQKPYLAERITPEETAEFVKILSKVAKFIPTITEKIPAVVRDPKDDYLLAYGLVGQANYLVTGDNDLLTLDQVDSMKIITPREFLEILESARRSRSGLEKLGN